MAVYLANTPVSLQVRLKFVFFRMSLTWVWEMLAQYSSSTTFSASKRKFHCPYPSGGSLQASAVIFARCAPSNLIGRPLRGLSQRHSKPSTLYFVAQVDTVWWVVPTVSATDVKVLPRSSSSKAVARLKTLALSSPWFVKNCNRFRSSSLSCTCCFFMPLA